MSTRAVILLGGFVMLNASAVDAADRKVDAELLEFLGSIEEGDEDFLEYLEQAPRSTPAKAPAKPESKVKVTDKATKS
jgi:hypothetical protein